MYSPLLVSLITPMEIIAAFAVIILAVANFTIIDAQQQLLPTNQPPVIQNGTTLFQSTNDSFRVQVPEGGVIHDVNNTGSMLLEEVTQGYGILAQLCPQEQQQIFSNVCGSIFNSSSARFEEDIIHIIRYPDLDARLQFALGVSANNITTDNILSYHVQKLQEVGYRNIEIVNSTETTVNVTNAQTNQTIAIVPAKAVEMTYVTNFAPNENRAGYFILTATNATAPIPETTKGYTIFYEGNSTATNATSVIQTTTTASGYLSPPLPAPVRQVFDSFELIAAEEVAQTEVGEIESDCESEFETEEEEVGEGGGEEEVGEGGGEEEVGEGGGEEEVGEGGEVEEPANLLTVDIISNGTEGVAPATFEFEANITGGAEPYSISWNFNDSGEESEEQTVLHTFDEAGTYNVTLTITDSEGQTASASIEITIKEPPPAEETVCDSSYPNLCISPPPPDLDCSNDGVPENFQVLPPDPHGFDSDNDGIGCESSSNQPEPE
jgi:PKD repeat protein